MRRTIIATFCALLLCGGVVLAQELSGAGVLPSHADIGVPRVNNLTLLTGTWTCLKGDSWCREDSASGDAKTELADGDVILMSDGSTWYSFTVADADSSSVDADNFRRARLVEGALQSTAEVLPLIDSSALYLVGALTASTLDTVVDGYGNTWPFQVAQDEIAIPSGVTFTVDPGATMSCPACTDFTSPQTVTATGTNTATFIGADAASPANTLLDTTGAGNITVGSADVLGVTITTDSTADGSDLVLPENAVSGNEAMIPADSFIACGEHDENGTIYFGPATAPFLGDGSTSYAIGTGACDALDNATEATADAPLLAGLSYKITGMFCYTDATLGAAETIVFTARSAEANLTPSLTCTIGEAATFCRTTAATTTDVAAGATVAVKAVETSNNADGDESWCRLYIQMQ